MNIELTELIVSQARTLIVMAAAGVFVESMWQIKKRIKTKRWISEVMFWAAAAAAISAFLYYCAFGKLSMHAAAGFLTGLLLWKKICCGIIKKVWVENEEAENLKTTAVSSISKKQGSRGWRKGGRKEKKKKSA